MCLEGKFVIGTEKCIRNVDGVYPHTPGSQSQRHECEHTHTLKHAETNVIIKMILIRNGMPQTGAISLRVRRGLLLQLLAQLEFDLVKTIPREEQLQVVGVRKSVCLKLESSKRIKMAQMMSWVFHSKTCHDIPIRRNNTRTHTGLTCRQLSHDKTAEMHVINH